METCVLDLNQLNAEQKRAVETIDGPLLVLAGAGSGKTRVVTYRIVNLIRKGVSPSEILGLTFTNKAAQEMRERIEKVSDQHVLIATFHSLGARLLRESISTLGYTKDFTIYDEDDSGKLIKSCLQELNLPFKRADIKEAKNSISYSKNQLIRPSSNDPFYQLYQEKLKSYNAVDFDDLLYLPVTLFQDFPEVLERYQNCWRYLLIDEYQDTNKAQYTWIKLIVEKWRNICVVGDPDQSIYSWRGANLQNILNFEKDYPEAVVIRLEQNYRSVKNVLEAANALIQYNEDRLDKNLWSALGDGEKIKLYSAHDDRDEARYLADKIETLEVNGTSLDDIVVFYRTNAQSRILEDIFLSNRIPYQIIGGLSFYQRKEIKDLLAYLRMVFSDSDFISFLRTINLPKRGIGPSTIEKIRQEANSKGLPIFKCLEQLTLKMSPKQKKGVEEYVALIQSLRQVQTVPELVTHLVQQSGYIGMLKEDLETFDDRKENVEALIAKSYEWEQEHEDPTLSKFLEELSLKANLDEQVLGEQKISLMTIHNGKGLEYPVVFLVGLEETLFPHINSQGNKESLEEERRLCYVGITRAKEKLYISHARSRNIWGSWRSMNPSRFLIEIPYQYVERIRT
ncbi:UvrD-helicase domain-containing protein [Chlamydiales bacterium]|nr:UvrD-helicase domain-containing protein [Chlamydiales bacterium]